MESAIVEGIIKQAPRARLPETSLNAPLNAAVDVRKATMRELIECEIIN